MINLLAFFFLTLFCTFKSLGLTLFFPFIFSEASIYDRVHWQHGGYYLRFHGASQLCFFGALLCVTGILNPLFSSYSVWFLKANMLLYLFIFCIRHGLPQHWLA